MTQAGRNFHELQPMNMNELLRRKPLMSHTNGGNAARLDDLIPGAKQSAPDDAVSGGWTRCFLSYEPCSRHVAPTHARAKKSLSMNTPDTLGRGSHTRRRLSSRSPTSLLAPSYSFRIKTPKAMQEHRPTTTPFSPDTPSDRRSKTRNSICSRCTLAS